MYLGLFGLNEPPFRITPHTDFFFDGANRGATLEALLYAITHDEGIVKVVGEVGSGKTMLCRVLMERLPASVETIYLANPSLKREEILYAIADELHLKLQPERSAQLLRELQGQLISLYASGKRVVVLIDEAHAMPKDTLEEIRLLSNLESGQHKLLQIVLFGQPELDELLGGPDMRQLKERITHSFALEPLVTGDIDNYIDFRMRAAGYRGPKVFNKRAVRMISSSSEGLTRRVNILADKALLAAFAGGTHAVTYKEARAAIRDSDFYRPKSGHRRWWLAAATLGAGVVLGAVATQLLQVDKPAAAPEINPAAMRPSSSAAQIPSPPAPAQTDTGAAATPAPGAMDPATTPGTPGTATPALTVPATATPPSTAPSAATPVAASPAAVSPAAGQTTPSAPAASVKSMSADSTAKADAFKTTAAKPEAVQTRVALTTPAADSASAAASLADSNTELQVPTGKLSAQVFQSTQTWLKSAGEGFSIQLLTVKANEIEKMERFIKRAANDVPLAELHLYSVKINGQQHYRAAYGYFHDQQEITSAINNLPTALAGTGPFSRSVARMRSQNRQ